VASEIRPVFAEELALTGLEVWLAFDSAELRPFLWAKQNVYLYRGDEIAKIHAKGYDKPLDIEWKGVLSGKEHSLDNSNLLKRMKIVPVDIGALVAENRDIMGALVSDTLKRIKEMYDAYVKKCDAIYISFSGGKDSVVLLDLCHKVLPLDVPVVFCDTYMELPDTYRVWDEIQNRYEGRPFLKVSAKTSALENWRLFGPPSQSLRWCCSVHKSTPAILTLKKRFGKRSIKTLAFVGVRSEESQRRSAYDDIGDGLKSQSQVNAMPMLAWSAHELWLYIFEHDLVLNRAYRKGLPRVGCLMCPMSTDRQNDLIRMKYHEAVAPFADAVRDAIDREFSSKEDADAFVFEGGWCARKSGVSLKQVIMEPGVERKKDRIVCEFPIEVVSNLKEWLKAIGKIDGAELSICEDGRRGLLQCVWANGRIDKCVSKWLVYAVHKAIACIGCDTCEAECPIGALRLKKDIYSDQIKVSIDDIRCVHCMKCYAPDEGCLRYYSKRYAGAKTMNIGGINKYMTFGLKPEWIEVLANEGANFRQTTALGNRMVPAAVTWFREAGLIGDSTAINTTLLLDVGKNRSFSDLLLWQLMWFRLANLSPLVKWYVCNTELDTGYPMRRIEEKLAQFVGSASVRKGALQSLCQLIKSSPLSEGDNPLVETVLKGRTVEKLTRYSRSVDQMVILYGAYVMAEKSGCSVFTIRQMMTTEFEGDVVSPMSVFGISPEEFKKQCMGLAAVHPDYIACSFTLGLDEVRVFPETKNRDDVITLILENN
jgi:3'-phosphoadenosine 5'-phosphosulfate sulfotransferase (PAPS reductase)/FAD synthetase